MSFFSKNYSVVSIFLDNALLFVKIGFMLDFIYSFWLVLFR